MAVFLAFIAFLGLLVLIGIAAELAGIREALEERNLRAMK